MNEDDKQQPVADQTNVSAPPDTAAPSAPDATDDTFDKLNAEYEQRNAQRSSPAPQQQQQPQDQDRLLQLEQKFWKQNAEREENQVVEQLMKENPGISRRSVQGWINQMAREEPGLSTAFREHVEGTGKPREWERWKKVLSREFAREHSNRADKAATEDREAVTAAVKGASTKAPEAKPPNFGNMSPGEFSKFVRDNYGYDPGV